MSLKNIVLILGQNDEFTHQLFQQFSLTGLQVHLLTKEVINHLKVVSESGPHYQSCYTEVSPGLMIDFRCVLAVIILDFHALSCLDLKDHRDRSFYIKSSWLAFWMHGLSLIDCVVNRLHHEMLSPCYFSLPRVYKLMSQNNFRVPKWYFDSLGIESRAEELILMSSLGCRANFSENANFSRFGIVKPEGVWINVLYFNQTVLAIRYGSRNLVDVSDGFKEKIIDLCQAMRLDIAESLFLCRHNQWIGYGLTAWPNWKIWLPHWETVIKSIISRAQVEIRAKKKNHTRVCMKELALPQAVRGAGYRKVTR